MTAAELAAVLADAVHDHVTQSLAPVRERLAAAEAALAAFTSRSHDDALAKELGALRERVAVVETKGGPPGKDGTDGLGWDDLAVEHDGERGFTVKMIRGEQAKPCGTFQIPAMIYRGVWEAKSYEPGDVVTWAGSSWHCQKPTATKPDSFEGAAYWKLMVKKGRDGK